MVMPPGTLTPKPTANQETGYTKSPRRIIEPIQYSTNCGLSIATAGMNAKRRRQRSGAA